MVIKKEQARRKKISENTKKALAKPHIKAKIIADRKRRRQENGYINSPQTRKKISEIWKNKWANGEVTEKQRNNLILSREGGKKTQFKKGHRQSKKSRKKMSLSTLKYIKDNPQELIRLKEMRKYQIFPLKDSSIEIKIQNYLKELQIEFFTHQYMNIKHGYQCDILIPSINIVIECDGDYWHNYPIGKDVDHIRTSELIEKGFKVLRLWEFEINQMSLNKFKKRLKNGM